MKNLLKLLSVALIACGGLYFFLGIEKEIKEKPLRGKYVNVDDGMFTSITFKGDVTCVVVDGMFQKEHVAAYIKDNSYVRVKSDTSDLLFTIVNDSVLIGEGYAEGKFVKSNEEFFKKKVTEEKAKPTKEELDMAEYVRKKVGSAFGKK